MKVSQPFALHVKLRLVIEPLSFVLNVVKTWFGQMNSKDAPQKLRPYLFHGIDLGTPSNSEAVGDCPFCDKSNKFSVNEDTGKWKCWSGSCGESGNIWTFLRKFHVLCFEATTVEDYKSLAVDRDLYKTESLVQWQIVKSITTDEWLIPGYGVQKREITSLYRYIKQRDGGYRLLPTPTLGHHLHGLNLWNTQAPIVYVTEGPWDAVSLWEALGSAKNCHEGGLCSTASRESSLLAQANVIAVPGCEVFFETWTPLLEGKTVTLVYDSDHPRKHPKTGKISDGAGIRAVKKVANLLIESKHKPFEVNYLKWGEGGYDPSRKSGFDVSDLLTKGI